MDEFKIDTFIFCSLAGVSCGDHICVTRMAPGVTKVFLRVAVCGSGSGRYIRGRNLMFSVQSMKNTWLFCISRNWFTRVTVIASLRYFGYDRPWSMSDENVRKLSRVSSGGGHKSTPVKHETMLFLSSCSSPFITEYLLSMPRSWSLLSITSLAALGSATRYGTPSEASIIRQISHGWVIFLQPASVSWYLPLSCSLVVVWWWWCFLWPGGAGSGRPGSS